MKQKKYRCYAAVCAAVIPVIFLLTLLMRYRQHMRFSEFSQYSVIRTALYCILGFFSARMFLDFFRLAERYVVQILTAVYAFLLCLAVSFMDRGLWLFHAVGQHGACNMLAVVPAFAVIIIAEEAIDLIVSRKRCRQAI